MAENKLLLENVELAYKEKNTAGQQTILCLHALGHSSKDYSKMFEDDRFNEYRIIALDFPGHGNSADGKETVSSAYYARLTEKLIDQLQLKNIVVLGNSIGGAVAIRLASNKKNNITSIQLANPAGLDKGGLLPKFFLPFMVFFFKKGQQKHPKFQKWFKYYYQKVLPSAEAIDRRNEIIGQAYQLAPILVEGWKSFALPSEDIKKLIPEIDCPVLVTWAMKDKKVQYSRNIGAVNKIKQLDLVKYKIGHTPILENPKQFLNDLFEFLATKKVAFQA